MSVYSWLRKTAYFIDKKRKENFLRELVNRGLRLGKNVYIASDFYFDPSHCYLISIGDNCGFAPGVKLITHDGSSKWMGLGFTRIGRIDIREHSYIGESAIVLPGVNIGPNSLVGAGAVVTSDVPPNTVVAGNPARVIVSTEEYINKIKEMSKGKKIFNEEYYIDRLDETKRQEILQTIGNSIGFIV